MIFKTLPSIISSINQLGEASNKLKTINFSMIGLNAGNLDAYRNAISGISKEQAALLLSTQGLNQAQIDLVLSNEKVTASEIAEAATLDGVAKKKSILTVEQQKQLVSSQALTTEKLAEISATLGLETAENGSLISKKALNAEMVKQQLESIGIVGSTQAQIMSMLGLTTAEASAATASNVLSGAMAKLSLAMSTNPIGALITVIGIAVLSVYGLTKAFDALTDSAEEIDERADDLISKYNDLKTTADNNASTVESLADEYESLSKGVNDLGENVSLTSEEYARYNEIVNQIADMFPTLITGYTDEGTAILSLKGNVEQLRDAYKEAQQEAYNLLVATGNDSYGNDIMESYKNLSELDWWDSSIGAEDVTTTVKRDITKQILDLMSNMDTAVEEYDKLAQTIFDTYGDKGYNFLEEMGLPAIKDVFSYTSGITEEALIAGRATVQSYYQGFQSEIDTKLSKVKLMANAFLNTNDFYLDDSTNSELKNALSVMVNSNNEELANSFNGEQVKVGAYVNNIVNSIKGNEEVQKELIDLFTIDTTDMPVSDIVEQINGYINSISIAINEDPEELKVRLGFDYVDDLESHYQRAVDFTKNKFDGYDATAFFKEHSINTQEEIDAWQKIAQGAKDAAEAEKEYIQGSTSNIEPTISSFENAWASLATTDNDSLKSLKDDLLELAEAGQLTFETFNETEGSGDFLAQLGLTSDNISDVEDIIKKINELKSSADQLASMKKGISPLSENLYNKQQEPEKEISVDVFAGMDEGLKKQKKEWENYVTVLGNASSSTEAVQNATNELATAYVNSNNFLANLTAANKDYYTSQLSAMGVENAEEVVTASLSAQKEILAIKEQALAVTKDGVTASTAGEINALLNEANASETTRAYLFQLTAAEQVFNNQSLDTSGKIRALGELATAYGQTAIAAKIAAWEQAAADSHTQSSYSEADLKHLQEEMNANINSTKIDVNAYAGSAKSGGSGSGKSGSSAKEESIETFDFIETAVKRIEAAIERLKTKAEETFRSFTSRGREYKKAISEITKEIEIQRQGYDAYIAKANSIGLEESWAGQVRDGSINIADVSDDGLKERIKNYKEWWNHATLFSNG